MSVTLRMLCLIGFETIQTKRKSIEKIIMNIVKLKKNCKQEEIMKIISCSTLPSKTGASTPQELKELAESLPPYSPERDCGFEALNVFEKFGGDIVIAQQGFIDDGIYSVKKTIMPTDLAELVGPNAHRIFSWWGVWYLYYAGFGCYKLSLVKNLEIIEHRGINMKQNGPHIWNIINEVVIDISWAYQNIETFFETVIVKNYGWNEFS